MAKIMVIKGKAVELESFGDVPGKGLQGAYQGDVCTTWS